MLRGEVWLVNLEPTLGSEIRKTRPAVIVSSDLVGVLPVKVIVPFTDWKDRYRIAPWMVRVDPSTENGLGKPSAADGLQVRAVSEVRFVRRMGKLGLPEMTRIVQAIMKVLQY